MLRSCFPASAREIEKALSQLDAWSFTIFRKFLDVRAIFAGSDFDQAVRDALEEIGEIDFKELKSLAGLQPVLGKRHYHETGALRWFEANTSPLRGIVEAKFRPEHGARFLPATQAESEDQAKKLRREAARKSGAWDIVVGLSKTSSNVAPLAREPCALDRVGADHPELAGDPVARREVSARLAALQATIETDKAFDNALWFRKHREPEHLRHADPNVVASGLADRRFDESPRLHNELLGRKKPSGSACAEHAVGTAERGPTTPRH